MASLWCLLMCVIIGFGVSFGFSVLILWLVFITHKIKFNVTDATLTQFNFTNNDTQLHYNLGVYFTIRNPNEQVGIYYDTIEATTSYKDQNFHTRLLTPFYQTPKTTSLLKGRFEGQQLVVIANNKVSEFNTEKLAGVYSIDVKFRLSLRLKFGLYKIIRVRPKVGCGFQLPLNSSGTSSFPWFQTAIGCHVDY
ncbi:NDR1/HIN1-like protein 10 [Benincasa hispida]|uniref:NDR1/HIN1-like protein 10 n=1 Tax=Benincasa hispida TaxID=102211 RepID=UPI0019008619|nr:NDR1/HIN1-like protein 10 [Benincasa hispida]